MILFYNPIFYFGENQKALGVASIAILSQLLVKIINKEVAYRLRTGVQGLVKNF